MKKLVTVSAFVLLAFVALTLSAFKIRENSEVKGWYIAGSQPDAYEIGIEGDSERNGKAAYLKSVKQVKTSGFGTIMQSFAPKDYLGKRVRLTGHIKSKEVAEWAGMWFRIDGEEKGKMLGFDNMQGRPIKGNTGWTKYEIVLDVPQNSKLIAYGVLLAGSGTVWLDDLNFEIVNSNVPHTNIGSKLTLDKPFNSNFEDTQD